MPTADEQVVVDGQRALAVSEVSGDFIYDGGATDAYCIVNNNGTAQRALKVANVGEGGGGGGTVDQTYDPTSTNAQSGTAVAEAVAPTLKNTATGTNALTILGTPTNVSSALNIGVNASVGINGSTAIGTNSRAGEASTAIGSGINWNDSARASGAASVAIGHSCSANSASSIAIGVLTQASAAGAIQLGQKSDVYTTATNSNANTFQVYEYQLLDGTTGLIPAARIGTGYDATKTQVLKNVNGTLTWVDE